MRLRQQVGMSVEDVEKLYPVVLPVALGNGRGVERKGSVRGGPGYSRRRYVVGVFSVWWEIRC